MQRVGGRVYYKPLPIVGSKEIKPRAAMVDAARKRERECLESEGHKNLIRGEGGQPIK